VCVGGGRGGVRVGVGIPSRSVCGWVCVFCVCMGCPLVDSAILHEEEEYEVPGTVTPPALAAAAPEANGAAANGPAPMEAESAAAGGKWVEVFRHARLLFWEGGVRRGLLHYNMCLVCVHRYTPSSRWGVRSESWSGRPVDFEACSPAAGHAGCGLACWVSSHCILLCMVGIVGAMGCCCNEQAEREGLQRTRSVGVT
jgi:hypothetical protein